MKQLFVKFNDGCSFIYNINNNVDHLPYVNKYIDSDYVNSIVLQQYPIVLHQYSKEKNEPIIFK